MNPLSDSLNVLSRYDDREDRRDGNRIVFASVRQASDNIRQHVIPSLLENPISAKEAFYRLHEAEAGDDITVATGFPPNLTDDVNDFINRGERSIPGIRRDVHINVAHAMHISPSSLPSLERAVFYAIDELNVVNEVDALKKLSIIQAVLLIAHFPRDISGRTTEDFIVYLSQKIGFPLTISSNGYRGQPHGDEVGAVLRAQTELYEDMLFEFDRKRAAGVFQSRTDLDNEGNSIDYIFWKKFLEPIGYYEYYTLPAQRGAIKREASPETYMIECEARAHMVSTCVRIISAIQDPSSLEEIWRQYPSLQIFYENLVAARQRTYQVFPEQSGDVADVTMCAAAYWPIVQTHWRPDYESYQVWKKGVLQGLEWLEQHALGNIAIDIRKAVASTFDKESTMMKF